MRKGIVRVKLLLLMGVLLFCAPTQVYAYSSPYIASRFSDSPVTGQVIAKNGVVYAANYGTCFVFKIVNGTKYSVAGIDGQCGYSPDGSIAAQSTLQGPTSIDVGLDGTVYITEPFQHHIRAVLPSGKLTTIAGNGTSVDTPSLTDGPDARQTAFTNPAYVRVGPDNAIYTYDSGVIRRILPDGSTDHVVGAFGTSPNNNPYVEGGVANEHNFSNQSFNSSVPWKSWSLFDFAPNGDLFATLGGTGIIYKVTKSDGRIHTFNTASLNPTRTLEDEPLSAKRYGTYTGFEIDNSGTIWITGDHNAIQYISPIDQIVRTVAGGGKTPAPTPGINLYLTSLLSISIDNDGQIYYSGADPNGDYIGKLYIPQDSTAPTIQAFQSPSPNVNGWNNSSVNLTWDITDPDSSIVNTIGCATVSVSTETANSTYTCNATSGGGTNSQSVTIRLDKSAPSIATPTLSRSVTIPLLGPVLTSSSTTISAYISDNLSGVSAGEYFFDTDPGQGNGTALDISGNTASAFANISALSIGDHTLKVRSQDRAGNWSATASVSFLKFSAPPILFPSLLW